MAALPLDKATPPAPEVLPVRTKFLRLFDVQLITLNAFATIKFQSAIFLLTSGLMA
jgi:hypothetical protein